jgi:hypothetical protein
MASSSNLDRTHGFALAGASSLANSISERLEIIT